MVDHHRNVSPLRSLPKTIEARYYNRVRLALIRLGNPLRLELEAELRHMDMLLSTEEWLCLDRAREDLPLLAWSGFRVRERDALHAPVQCILHLYDARAGLLAARVLPVLDRLLEQALQTEEENGQ